MGDVLAVQLNLAFAQVEHAEDRLHGGRLAGAVGPDDDGDLALLHRDITFLDDVGAAIAAGHAGCRQELHPALIRSCLRPVPR